MTESAWKGQCHINFTAGSFEDVQGLKLFCWVSQLPTRTKLRSGTGCVSVGIGSELHFSCRVELGLIASLKPQHAEVRILDHCEINCLSLSGNLIRTL